MEYATAAATVESHLCLQFNDGRVCALRRCDERYQVVRDRDRVDGGFLMIWGGLSSRQPYRYEIHG